MKVESILYKHTAHDEALKDAEGRAGRSALPDSLGNSHLVHPCPIPYNLGKTPTACKSVVR